MDIIEQLKLLKEMTQQFKATHKSNSCDFCHEEIEPGNRILVNPLRGRIYCCDECLMNDVGACYLYLGINEDYDSWFEEI